MSLAYLGALFGIDRAGYAASEQARLMRMMIQPRHRDLVRARGVEMKSDYRYDEEKVEALRAKHELSMQYAVATVTRDRLRRDIAGIENLDDVRRVLLEAFGPLEYSDKY